MPLLKYELKKLLGRRGFITAILLLLVLNVLIICVSYTPGNYTVKNDELREVYRLYLNDKEAFGARYNELLAKSERGEDVLQELSYFQKVEGNVSYILEYPNKASAISSSAQRLLNESVRSGYSEGDYIYDYQKNTIELYSSAAENVRFPLTPLSGWNNYFNHTVVNYLLFAVIILLVSSVYVPERVGAIYPIIRTARKGRAPLSMAKLFAVMIGTITVTLLFFASSFAVFALREGFSTVMSPIQAIRTFETCPYIITVGEYFALNTLIRLGAFLLFGCISALFASAFCDYVGSFAASAMVLAVNFILNSIKYSSLSAPAKHLNLFSLTSVNEFFTRYYAAELGGNLCEFAPLYVAVVLIGSLLSLIGAFLFITYLRRTSGSSPLARFVATYLNKLRALCRKPGKNKTKVRRMKGGTLVEAEFRKLFSSRLIIALVLLILIARVAYSNSLYAGSKTAEELVYREYMEYLDGEWTEEKSEYIATESRMINEALRRVEALRQNGGEDLTPEERVKIFDDADYAALHSEPLKRVQSYEHRIFELEALGIENCEFTYDTGWRLLTDRSADLITLFGVLLVLSSVFGIEYNKSSSSGNFADILRSTKKGRGRTYLAKLSAALGVSFFAIALAEICDIVLIAKNYSLPHGTLPFAMILENPTFITEDRSEIVRFLGTSLWALADETMLTRIGAVMFFAAAVFVISAFVRKNIGVMIISSLAFLLPSALVSYGGLSILRYADFVNIASGIGLVYMSEDAAKVSPHFTVWIYAAVSFAVAVALLSAAFLRWQGKIRRN